jgi:hypothetical protein
MGAGSANKASAQTFANLTLTGNSTIDFSSLGGSSILTFTGTGLLNGNALSVWNWTEYTQLIFSKGETGSGLSNQLANISFFSGSGSGFIGTGEFVGLEIQPNAITPVPEPSVVLAGLLLLGWMLFSFRSHLLREVRMAPR